MRLTQATKTMLLKKDIADFQKGLTDYSRTVRKLEQASSDHKSSCAMCIAMCDAMLKAFSTPATRIPTGNTYF